MHVDAVVDRVFSLMVVSGPRALGLLAAAERIASQMALVAIPLAARGRRSVELVLEQALVRVGATTADARITGNETGPDG